jgi:2-phospho-L-lactate/phosphoenolpyruvate guanylyltransferase
MPTVASLLWVMLTAAILPVKRFAQAKQRLGASVADPLRLALARAMVGDVLAALTETVAIALTIVVTDESSVADSAHELGAIVIADTSQRGQSAAVALGIERALAEGMERVLCVPGDCPTLDPIELEGLLDAAAQDEPEVVIFPDRHGTGTNGLLLAPPDAIPPSFGPDSCERHRSLALAAGTRSRVERRPSLLLDIDTGEDLAALRARLSAEQLRAPRTRAVLGQSVSAHSVPTTTPV